MYASNTVNMLKVKAAPLPTTPEAALHHRIGNTPLIRLFAPVEGLQGITLLAKAEWANPSGSSADRAAAFLVGNAQQRGWLHPGKTILEASSGNMGVALAMLGATLGIPVQVVVPSNAHAAVFALLEAYGAKVERTAAEAGVNGAILRARELVGDHPEQYCYLDQFSAEATWLAHYQTTGQEIWQQTSGAITHFVAALGTSGTFLGAARKLKENKPPLVTVSVQPEDESKLLAGMRNMHAAFVPAIYNPHLASREVVLSDAEAVSMARLLAHKEGLLVGPSGAAAVAAAVQIAREEAAAGRQAMIVTLLPEGGERSVASGWLK
jgi:cysteine synthase B